MKEFRHKFIEDATELIKVLVDDLLSLRKNSTDETLIGAIFRSLHNLKGTAGMFGFDNITKISHSLENLFEEIRENNIIITKQAIQITFDAVDIIKFLLSNEQDITSTTEMQISDILQKVNELIPTEIEVIQNNEQEEVQLSKIKTYLITFKPKANFEQRGININDVFDEIQEIGHFEKIEVPTSKISVPEQDNLFYIFWEIYISTEQPIDELEDVFIFFQNEFEIKELASQNLFQEHKFVQLVNENKNSQTTIELSEINKIIANLKKEKIIEVKEKDSTTFIKKSLKKYKRTSIRVSAEKLDQLMNLVSELITTKATINILAEKYKIKELTLVSERMNKLAKNMQDNALQIRLVPINNMLADMKRLIYDLSDKLGKDIEFSSQGGETELDKNIVDNLSEPIMHIIRNCIDHGIESPEQRVKHNKSEKGRIKLTAFHSAGNVFIQIHDDGRGIDTDLIKKTAIDKGIISKNSQLNRKEIHNLIFTPGFTTAKDISEISGRGVGLDVVNQKIIELRGSVELNSELNLGTYITLKLPLTLSIIDTLLVSINNSFFLIPKYIIETIHEIEDYKQIRDNKYMLKRGKSIVPIINLIKRYGNEEQINDFIKIIVVKSKEKFYGLAVDKLIGNHQAVLKPIGEIFKTQEIFSSATILGDGNIALMFDINKLIINGELNGKL